MPAASAELTELTDEQVGKLLAGEAVRGPRKFRGRELSAYTSGLRDLVMKVVRPDDTGIFHDVALLYVLTEAHGDTPEARLVRRRKLIAASDDVETFRAQVSLEWMDTLSDDEIQEAKRVVTDILAPTQAAAVKVVAEVGKKKPAATKATRNRTTKPS